MKQYWLPLLIIVGWWSLAFTPRPSLHKGPKIHVFKKENAPSDGRFASDRPFLRKALEGDTPSMLCLIAKWDAEAEGLEKKGAGGVLRLSRKEYLEAFSLADSSLSLSPKTFFPQTFLSAGILAALVDPTSLQALPTHFRKQTHIYPEFLLNAVQFDSDPYHLELIRDPENTVAFVSPYSQPSTLQLLGERGVPIVQIESPKSMEGICLAIEQMGHIVGNPGKGRLLSLFVKAADQLLKNRVHQVDLSSTYLLQYFSYLSAPTEKLVMGKIAKEIGIALPNLSNNSWIVPVEIEDLLQLQPKKIVIASEKPERMGRVLRDLPLDCEIFLIDKDTYDTSSQYILLSYFDLCEILAEGS